MGICHSSNIALHHYNLKPFRSVLDELHFNDAEGNNLYHMFRQCDRDGSGEINIMEMLTFFDLERNSFTKRVFSIFDADNSGEIDFREFLAALWNYCTYDKESLIQFSFDLYDLDGSGEISVEEMTQILRELYGNKIDNSSYASRILGRIKDLAVQQGKGGQVSRDEFSQFTRTHPAMLFPAFQLQRQLQKKVLGVKFWLRKAKERAEREGKALDNRSYKILVRRLKKRVFDKFISTEGKAGPEREKSKEKSKDIKKVVSSKALIASKSKKRNKVVPDSTAATEGDTKQEIPELTLSTVEKGQSKPSGASKALKETKSAGQMARILSIKKSAKNLKHAMSAQQMSNGARHVKRHLQ